MRSNICIKGRLTISSKFITILVVTREVGGSRQTVTKCDKGGGGSKISGRPVTFFLNGHYVGMKNNGVWFLNCAE